MMMMMMMMMMIIIIIIKNFTITGIHQRAQRSSANGLRRIMFVVVFCAAAAMTKPRFALVHAVLVSVKVFSAISALESRLRKIIIFVFFGRRRVKSDSCSNKVHCADIATGLKTELCLMLQYLWDKGVGDEVLQNAHTGQDYNSHYMARGT